MEFVDIGTIASAAAGGTGVWAAIRADIKWLTKEVERLGRELRELRGSRRE